MSTRTSSKEKTTINLSRLKAQNPSPSKAPTSNERPTRFEDQFNAVFGSLK